MTRRNVVLLATDSRESQSKKRHYAAAAHALGYAVRDYPDRGTAAVIPCSDFKAVEAAWMCRLHGIAGSDPIAVAVASQKSLAYQFLQSRGFRTLYWQIPMSAEDLAHGFDRPVIVKPDRGSGSFSRHPWGYRTFRSLRAFRGHLERRGLLKRFLRHQSDPPSWTGPYIAMEYARGESLYGVASVIGEKGVAAYGAHAMRAMPGSMVVDRILFGERHRDMRAIARIAPAFAALGLRRTVLYVQCVERAGRLYPIDINLRPGTLFDLAIGALGLPFYECALAYMIGRSRTMAFAWPAARVGVRRVALRLKPGVRKARLGEGCIPLIDRLSYDPARPYDLGHAWPAFALLCRDRRDFDRRSAAVAAATRIEPARR